MEIKINNRFVGPGHPCLIVAEISANHNQSFDRAVEIIKAAASAGVDAIKLQTYTPDTMTIDSDKEWFMVRGKGNPDSWQGKMLYDLYKTAYTPWDWQPKLKQVANDLGLILFSTPFDETAVDFLEGMAVPCYKVASYEATDIPLLKKIAGTGKPIIISVGFASLEETKEAIETLRGSGAKEIAVLHCVTAYSDDPSYEDMNLKTINDLRERFGVVSGFSDNNAGIEVPVMAVLAGASIIEKHFTLRRSDGGPDSRFSLEPDEVKEMIKRIREAESTLGKVHYGTVNEAEEYNKRFRRSIFAVKNIRKGERFTHENIRVIRPAFGLPPRDLDKVLMRSAKDDIEIGTPLSWDMIL